MHSLSSNGWLPTDSTLLQDLHEVDHEPSILGVVPLEIEDYYRTTKANEQAFEGNPELAKQARAIVFVVYSIIVEMAQMVARNLPINTLID